MLRAGFISSQIGYFMEGVQFEADRDRAFEEFFGRKPAMLSRDRTLRALYEQHEGIFVEWFFFHSVLHNGKTPLAYILAENPAHASEEDLVVWRRIAEGWYGFHEIREVRPGEGLMLYDIMHKREVFAREMRGSMDARADTTILCRVVDLGDAYEIVGGDTGALGVVFGPAMQDALRTWMKKGWTPKDTYSFLSERKSAWPDEPQEMSRSEARGRIDAALVACGIDHFVDSARVERWMVEELFDIYGMGVVHALVGLALEMGVSDNAQNDTLVAAATALHNALPREALDNRSPNEARRVLDAAGEPHTLHVDMQKVIPVNIGTYQRDGSEAMRANNPERAIAVYNELFEQLRAQRVVFSDPFRVFANLGVSYLMSGDRSHGKHLLEIAHTMNPDYEFASRQIERLLHGDLAGKLFDGFLHRDGRVRKKSDNATLKFEDTPAGRYLEWLNKLDINFTGKVREEITEFRGENKRRRVVYRNN